MGLIQEVDLTEVLPSQFHLRETSLQKVWTLKQRRLDDVLGPPAVRRWENQFITLDGQHRLIVEQILGDQRIPVYIAESERDLLKYTQVPSMPTRAVDDTNQFIQIRYNIAMFDCVSLQRKLQPQNPVDMVTFEDLINHYGLKRRDDNRLSYKADVMVAAQDCF